MPRKSRDLATLPCYHRGDIVEQVPPAINLLRHLDELHPGVLLEHGIQPVDYHGGLVFRSAVESIRGTYIASSTNARQALVEDVLRNLYEQEEIAQYQNSTSATRCDFEIALQMDVYAGLEVKGGEGNSINISDRPVWAREFGIWSHLDGAIVNHPAIGATSVINRITNEMVRRKKHVDVLFFKDMLCGTSVRPCPKYPGRESAMGLRTAPDVFLFPKQVPVFSPDNPELHNPSPDVYDISELMLPQKILDLFEVEIEDRPKHVWHVHVEVEGLGGNRRRRIVTIKNDGAVVNRSVSRAWTESSRR